MVPDPATTDPDARFSLANERTFLAWIRTALAAIAGGLAAAKALPFHHETVRWLLATPPVLGGAALAGLAPRRFAATQSAMEQGRPIPTGQGLTLLGLALALYAALALLAVALD